MNALLQNIRKFGQHNRWSEREGETLSESGHDYLFLVWRRLVVFVALPKTNQNNPNKNKSIRIRCRIFSVLANKNKSREASETNKPQSLVS